MKCHIWHSEFVLYTDHDLLKHLHSQDKVSAQHASWIAYLQQFTFVVKHKAKVTNRIADRGGNSGYDTIT